MPDYNYSRVRTGITYDTDSDITAGPPLVVNRSIGRAIRTAVPGKSFTVKMFDNNVVVKFDDAVTQDENDTMDIAVADYKNGTGGE